MKYDSSRNDGLSQQKSGFDSDPTPKTSDPTLECSRYGQRYLESFEIFQSHFVPPRIIWSRMESSGVIPCHPESFEVVRNHSKTAGGTDSNSGQLRTTSDDPDSDRLQPTPADSNSGLLRHRTTSADFDSSQLRLQSTSYDSERLQTTSDPAIFNRSLQKQIKINLYSSQRET